MALSGGWKIITTILPCIGRKLLRRPSNCSRNSNKNSEIILAEKSYTQLFAIRQLLINYFFALLSYIFYSLLPEKSFISKSVHLGTFFAFLPSRDLAVVISLQVLQNLFELFLCIFAVSYAPCVSIFSPRRNRLVKNRFVCCFFYTNLQNFIWNLLLLFCYHLKNRNWTSVKLCYFFRWLAFIFDCR